MTSEILNSKAIILVSRPETVQVAVERLRLRTLGVIVSQEILEAVLRCSKLREVRGVVS